MGYKYGLKTGTSTDGSDIYNATYSTKAKIARNKPNPSLKLYAYYN